MKDSVSMAVQAAQAAVWRRVSAPKRGAFRPTTGQSPWKPEERNDHARR